MTSLGTLLATGAGVVWCSPECREEWLRIAVPREIAHDPVAVERDLFACQHCHWCGTAVSTVEDCLLHPDGCPRRSFGATSIAIEVVHELTPPGLIVPAPWTVLVMAERVWWRIPNLTPRRLARIATEAWKTAKLRQQERDELG